MGKTTTARRKRPSGDHGARIRYLEKEETNTRNKFSELYKKLNNLAAAPGTKANKEISAVKVGIVVAIATVVVQIAKEVIAMMLATP